MPGSVLNLNNAYDDGPLHDGQPMFRSAPRLTGSGRSTPRAIDWNSPAPSKSPLRLLDRPSQFGDSDMGRLRSPLALAPSSSFVQPISPPPRYAPRQDPDVSHPLPVNPKTPYEVLGVSEYATQDEIKKAYKRRALDYHPDKCHGSEDEMEEATRRFTLIAEAYAILGIPERRAEYNISRREGATLARSSSPYMPKTNSSQTFKSTFMPGKSESSRDWESMNDEDPTLQDLRYLDPFSLFSSMFPQYAKLSEKARGQSGLGERNIDRCGDFDLSNSASDLLNDPLMVEPTTTGRKGKSSQFRTVTEKQEKAHMDRHGRLNIRQSQRTMKVHESGGFTFSSTSFSGSFASGNGNMLAALMSGGMSFGSGDDGSGMSAPNMQGMLGMPDFGNALPPPRSLSRRPSFGSLEDHLSLSGRDPLPTSRAVARRPSFSQSSPYDMQPSSSSYGDDLSLAPYAGSRCALSKYGGW